MSGFRSAELTAEADIDRTEQFLEALRHRRRKRFPQACFLCNAAKVLKSHHIRVAQISLEAIGRLGYNADPVWQQSFAGCPQ